MILETFKTNQINFIFFYLNTAIYDWNKFNSKVSVEEEFFFIFCLQKSFTRLTFRWIKYFCQTKLIIEANAKITTKSAHLKLNPRYGWYIVYLTF